MPGLKLSHEKIFAEVKTLEQAKAYLEDLIDKVEAARAAVDDARLVDVQRKAFHNLLIRYGVAIGSLTTLIHARVVDSENYDRFAPRIHGAIVARVVNV